MRAFLEGLGLSEYATALVEEGFDTMERLSLVDNDDLDAVKVGARC